MKMLRIVAMKDGFRRAGMAHSTAPAEYPLSNFTAEQIKALKAEPLLVVQEFDGPDPKDDKKAGDKR